MEVKNLLIKVKKPTYKQQKNIIKKNFKKSQNI